MASMESLISLVNRIQRACTILGDYGGDSGGAAAASLPTLWESLPSVAVVGGQSSGKSSVLESIVGRDFLPRGSGIVTRRPLVLQLHKTEPGITEYAEFLHKQRERFTDFAMVRKEIQEETDKITGKSKQISPVPIHMSIYSPNVVNLTLIDLPGLTKVAVEGQPESIVKDIENMVRLYVEKPNCIILAVTPANQDIATSDAIKLAREVDPEGERTFGVLTKLDLMDKGTNAQDVLEGRAYPLQHPWVGIVNRSQADINTKVDMIAARQRERKFFSTSPDYGHMASRMGSEYLAKLLSKHLESVIKTRIPGITYLINRSIDDLESELDHLGRPVAIDAGAQLYTILELCRAFDRVFKEHLDGGRPGGDRIYGVFDYQLPMALRKLPFDRHLSLQNVRKQKITSKVRSRSSNSRYDSISTRSKVNMSACDSAAEKRAGEKQGLEVKRKPLDQMITSSTRASSSQLRSNDVSPSSKEKNVADGNTKKGIEELRESFIDLSPQQQPSENKNIVLLVPKTVSTNCSLQEPRTPLDKDLNETHRKSLSDVFSHVKVQSSERSSEILHSFPLISRKETDTEPHKLLHSAMVTQGAEMSADASPCSRRMPFRLSEDKFSGESSGRTAKGSVIETLNTLDQETMEVMARKGRHPSPNRRFSFSLSRMSRSFSFKESSAVPQLSSTYITTKSGPVLSEGSCLDNSNREKAVGHNRARSSPLRRMLDPLLKSRSSRTLHSTENNSSKESLNSFNLKRFDATEPLKDEKHEPARIKALLQLTIKNGVPLFRFVVGNNSNILAATMNKLSSPQKNDSGCDYTFYSIDEIKKKSGSWINQGSKEKSCGYAYNVIGRMKVNNSSSISGLTGPNSICQIKVKESVLFGVNLSQADQASPRFMANGELAAVVVKMLHEISSLDLQQTGQNKNLMHKCSSQCLPESQCSGNLGKTEHSNRFTVILPGGNHSLPNEGVPSPLIHRWRSGGSCDCGGWDVGCKLCILANGSQCSEIPRASKSCLMPDCFELFTEGANRQDQPIFSLARVEKGMYSIEFCSSISSLQAFFISVTVISCQKPTDLLDVSNASGEKFQQEPRNSSNVTKKIHAIPPGETHVKYTLGPPISPFERV